METHPVVEEAIEGREFECAVLGNERPEASVVGELVPSHEFYDYADKYVDRGAQVVIPAAIPAAPISVAKAGTIFSGSPRRTTSALPRSCSSPANARTAAQ